jgi:NAD(P)-dependent dehydrogenase (short-subunit alcohol dehydrogenase family)
VSATAPGGRLAGRVALVTGAGRGFGRTMAVAFARESADVVVNYHASATGAKDVGGEIEALGRQVLAVQADVAREEPVRTMFERALERFGRIDMLVNNAGIMTRGAFADTPVAADDSMWAINVTGTATKGAIEAFTRAIALEYGGHSITVNAIAPGGIDTDMSRAVMTPEYRARRIQELPVRHLGEVEDVAYCALFLATEQAHYLTGQVLQPNGGWVMP